jgi:glutamate dehydrogenase/leucine dehydrogenase
MDPQGLRVAIQGFGNVGEHAAQLLADRGFSVIAVSDVNGGVRDPRGLDIKALREHKAKTGSVVKFPGAADISNSYLLVSDCDVLIPAALSNQLDANNASQVKARIILELANAPTTAAADDIFFNRDILLIPDILANAGGVVVSYFEWSQNLTGDQWPENVVLDKLKQIMKTAFLDVHNHCREPRCRMRKGAYELAVKRILNAERLRGNL